MGLNIVEVAHSFPPYFGGLSYVTEMLSRSLVKQGNEVEVVTLDPSGRLRSSEELDGIRVRRFSCLAPSNSYFVPSPKVVDYIRSLRADIVHAHNLGALLVPACWFAVRGSSRTAFILSPHHHSAGSAWHSRILWRPYKPVAKHIAKAAAAVHCVSEFEAHLVKEDFEVTPVVIQNGVSDDVFTYAWNPPVDRLVLVYAGRVENYKRLDVLLEAARALSRQGRDVTVRIVGEGQGLSKIVRLSEMLGVNMEHFSFLGRREYLRILSTSSCLVNPSMYEAFSVVTAEAIAIGMPAVVSTPWGETFRGQGAVALADGGSPVGVAAGISRVVGTRTTTGANLQTWDAVCKRLLKEVYVCSPGVA